MLQDGDDEVLQARTEVCPPSSAEALSLPLRVVSSWLAGHGDEDLADVEGQRSEETDEASSVRVARRAIAWRQDGAELVRTPAEIRAGDTLLVPASYGGLSAGN